MIFRSRFLALFAIFLLTLTLSGIAVAQSDNPDPNAPVLERTPTPANDQKEDRFPTSSDEDNDSASPPGEATPIEGEATPIGDATPVAVAGDVDLAAMTLDSNTIPEDFFLIAEYYTSPEQLAENYAGQIDDEALFATGIQTFYQSFYLNADGNRVRTYIIAYDTIDGARAGFELFENEEELLPNGSFQDSPGPAGVGETPSEITSGIVEQGDGTQQRTYDISYRIDRFEVGVAMETYDGSEVDEDLIDELAVELADRVQGVIDGDDIESVDINLPAQVVQLDADTQIEGYQTAAEAFLIDDPDLLPEGYVSGYYRGASFSTRVTTFLPFVSVGISQFTSDEDLESALDDPEVIMPSFPDLDEIGGLDVDGADDVVGFGYSSSQDVEEPDSVRLFVQVDDQLIVIDVQGVETVDDAETIALNIADAELACALDGECEESVSIDS